MARIWLRAVVLVAAAALLFVVLAACSDGDVPSTRGYDDYARAFCQATAGFAAHYEEVTPRSPWDAVNAQRLVPLWDEFIRALRAADPPKDLASWHRDYLTTLQENADRLRAGNVSAPYDPFDDAPAPPAAAWKLLTEAMQRAPECQRTPVPSPAGGTTTVPVATPTATSAPAVDHSSPSLYLMAGTQSTLSPATAALVDAQLAPVSQDVAGLARIHAWMVSYFRTEPDGGRSIGKTDVNGLVASRTLTGCHDWALVMTALARHFGVPAIMADSAGIQWVEDYRAGRAGGDVGHVFGEFFLAGRWLLVDCTSGLYTLDYDPSNPVIPLSKGAEGKGFYALFQGVDPASYGVSDGQALHARFLDFAARYPGLDIRFPTYSWQPLGGR
ncbi:MAG: transglutaminase domain-containing protein [Dehalococcoidia bacterium]|nr:transglutaminase domain-containing protein [Dehalococcoidia bacterium]